MPEHQNLNFNILTFNWPKKLQNFYFSDEKIKDGHTIYKTLFPYNIEALYPDIQNSDTDKISTTFTGKKEGFHPVAIDFKNDNPDLIKRFYNRQINFYFRVIKKQIVKVGFIKENQIWIHSNKSSNAQWNAYHKYSLKVQLKTVSEYPEILLSYDGSSKVLKKNITELIKEVSPVNFTWVMNKKNLLKWDKIPDEELPNYDDYYPVLNRNLVKALSIPSQAPPRDNRYSKYNTHIKFFYNKFLNTKEFKKIIPLREETFLEVEPTLVNSVVIDSNMLKFGTNSGIVPKFGIRDYKPFKPSPFKNIHLFFIVHKDDIDSAKKIKKYFEDGFEWFKGLQKYAHIVYHTEEGFSITFKNRDNPITEITQKLFDREFNPDVKYIAIYITPYGKFEQDSQKREIYYKVKELLLKRNITSQAIDPVKLKQQGTAWVYSLPNIAVAILAKLEGIPWRLNTPIKNELIIGVGAFKHIEEDIQYIGSAFSFANNGQFNRFEYYMKDETEILAGSISNSIKEYATLNNKPDRLIIHFYKTMSENELAPIQKALESLGLSVPVYIVSINKTESKDIVAFDYDWNELMPKSGTYINIGQHKYLLYNNTRYPDGSFSKQDGYPFPVKLKIDCTEKERLEDIKTVKELIDQVYQFSRMYWKSVRQQNLPVTIKYPEMVAKIAPHFESNDIPDFGKDNLWFL